MRLCYIYERNQKHFRSRSLRVNIFGIGNSCFDGVCMSVVPIESGFSGDLMMKSCCLVQSVLFMMRSVNPD